MEDLQLLAGAALPTDTEDVATFVARCPPGGAVVAAVGKAWAAEQPPAAEQIAAAWTSKWDGRSSMLHFAAEHGLTVGGWMFEVSEAKLCTVWQAVLEGLAASRLGLFAAASPLRESYSTLRIGTSRWTDKEAVDAVLQELRLLGVAQVAEYTVSTFARVDDSAVPVSQVVWRATADAVASQPAEQAASPTPSPTSLSPPTASTSPPASTSVANGVPSRTTPKAKKSKGQRRREQRSVSMLIDGVTELGIQKTNMPKIAQKKQQKKKARRKKKPLAFNGRQQPSTVKVSFVKQHQQGKQPQSAAKVKALQAKVRALQAQVQSLRE